ncbi:amidohydrolase family protein [bacterium]|nr:amidohydrolase family protein [bacterium]
MLIFFIILWSVTALLVLRLILFSGPFSENVEDPPKGIIDMHCHTAGIGSGGSGALISNDLRNSWKFDVYLKTFGSSEDEVHDYGDHILVHKIVDSIRDSEYVDGAVLLALDAPRDGNGDIIEDMMELYVPNEYIAEQVKSYPELYFGASIHPNRPDSLNELNWSKENGAVLVKWLPNIQEIDPSDERYIPYYKKLIDLDLPLLVHTGDEESFTKTNDKLGDPVLLTLPLQLGVKVIAAHVASSGKSAGYENIDRLLGMMEEFPNLVADISSLTQVNKRKNLRKVITDKRLSGRLLYGTDYPLINTPLVTPIQYFLNLTFKQMWALFRTRNPWDRDVKLKSVLGFNSETFNSSRKYFNIFD